MTNPTARAVASIGATAACGVIGWNAEVYAALALVAMVVSLHLIWKDA